MRILLTNTAAEWLQPILQPNLGGDTLEYEKIALLLHEQKRLESTRFVVPGVRTARWLSEHVIQVVTGHTGAPSPGIRTDTLHTLIRSLYAQHAEVVKRPIGPVLRYLLLRSVMEESTGLQYYSNTSRSLTEAVVDSVCESLEHVIQTGYSAEAFAKLTIAAGGGVSRRTSRLQDLESLLASYEIKLGDTLVDIPGVFQELTSIGGPKPSPEISAQQTSSAVIIDMFSDFSDPEVQVLLGLGASSIATAIVLSCDTSNPTLFGGTSRIVETLTRGGFVQIVSEGPIHPDIGNCWSELPKRLFASHALHTSPPNPVAGMRVVAARNRTDEVQTIARYVKHTLRYAGVLPHEVAVVSRRPDTYVPQLEREFSDSGIPFVESTSGSLATSPVVHAFFTAVDCSVREFHRDDVERVLSNPWLNVRRRMSATDLKALHRVSRELRIIGGKENDGAHGWMNSLTSASKRMKELHRASLETEENRRVYKDAMVRYEKAEQIISDLQKLLPNLNKQYSPKECERLCCALWTDLGISSSIDELVTAHIQSLQQNPNVASLVESPELITRQATSFLSLIHELATAEDECGTTKRSFKEFTERLRALVHTTNVRVREKAGAGVFLGGMDQIRGINYKVVVVAGMTEGVIPSMGVSGELTELETDSTLRHEYAERQMFYSVLASRLNHPTNGLPEFLLSYPKANELNEECLPSQFLDALQTAVAPQVLDTDNMRAKIRNGDSSHSDDSVPPWIHGIVSHREIIKNKNARTLVAKNHGIDTEQSPISAYVYEHIDDLRDTYPEQRMNVLSLLDTDQDHVNSNDADTIDTTTNDVDTNNVDTHVVDSNKAVTIEVSTGGVMNGASIDDAGGGNSHVVEPREVETHPVGMLPQTVSISELELYAACPFRYYASRQLRLPEQPADDLEVTAAERGDVLHRIAYLFYTSLANDNTADVDAMSSLGGVKLNTNSRDVYLTRLLRIANDVLRELEFNHPFYEVLCNSIMGSDNAEHGILAKWLDGEIARQVHTRFEPCLFEVEFGATREGEGKEFLISGVSFRGRIDRIDVREQPDGTVEFLVVDYKSTSSGIKKNSDIVTNGTSFQVPVYIRAAKSILEERFGDREFVARGGLYVVFDSQEPYPKNGAYVLVNESDFKNLAEHLTSNSTTQVLKKAIGPVTTEEAIQVSLEHLQTAIDGIRRGLFPVAPANARTCEYCSLGSVCGIEDIRRTSGGAKLAMESTDDVVEE